MNKFFLHPIFVKPVFISLLWVALFLSPDISGQKKTSLKSNPAKSSHKKIVIYGLASFYHNKFEGRQTANGEIFSQKKLTCACNMLPFGTWLKITNVLNGKFVVVKVNDRLHPRMRRIADLSKAAAYKIGATGRGIVRVKVQVLGKRKPA